MALSAIPVTELKEVGEALFLFAYRHDIQLDMLSALVDFEVNKESLILNFSHREDLLVICFVVTV